jgi:hypothetical protein
MLKLLRKKEMILLRANNIVSNLRRLPRRQGAIENEERSTLREGWC